MRVDAESPGASHGVMHRIAEDQGTRAPLVVLVVALALGAAICVRVHRAPARANTAVRAGSAQALVPSAAAEAPPETPRR